MTFTDNLIEYFPSWRNKRYKSPNLVGDMEGRVSTLNLSVTHIVSFQSHNKHQES
jgi:hypothetical protein